MKRNLVMARVGVTSLHPRWVGDGASRDWDLVLVPYQEIPAQAAIDCATRDIVQGPKWSGLREALNEWGGWRDYDYVWFPDDDIAADPETIDEMFDVARTVGLDLFAPALHESSYYAHFDTMKNRSLHGRWVGFVEIMIPGFSTSALDELLPTLDLSETGWGWGLDSVWPKLLDYKNVGIIDSTTVTHTRPVGEMRDAELRRRVHAESDSMLESHDCRQVHATFGAFGPDLQRVDTTPDDLLVQLVSGWQYLVERDPRVLAWIMDFQRAHFPPQPYPIEGTPEIMPGV